MVVYDTCSIYIESGQTLQGKIAKINNIISALEDAAIKGAGTANLSEYSLDDGQSKIMTGYRSISDVVKAISDFEKIKQMYINRLNGRSFRLVDQANFRRRYNGYF